LTPTNHLFDMNAGHQDAASLRVDTPDGLPVRTVGEEELASVSASASRSGDRVLVSLSNLDATEDVAVDLDLRGGSADDVQARILSAGSLAAHNAPGHAAEVAPVAHDGVTTTERGLQVELPAHAFVAVSVAVQPWSGAVLGSQRRDWGEPPIRAAVRVCGGPLRWAGPVLQLSRVRGPRTSLGRNHVLPLQPAARLAAT